MANLCDYEIHVRGTKKAALMVYAVMRCADEKAITFEKGTEKDYTLHFSGCCKWEPDAYCDKEWNGEEIDLNSIEEESIRREESVEEFESYKLIDMSGMFHCEIEIYACYEEGETSFSHYKDGQLLDEQYSMVDMDAFDADIDFEVDEDDSDDEDMSQLFDF